MISFRETDWASNKFDIAIDVQLQERTRNRALPPTKITTIPNLNNGSVGDSFYPTFPIGGKPLESGEANVPEFAVGLAGGVHNIKK